MGVADPKIWGGYLPASGGGVRGHMNTVKGNVHYDHVLIKLTTQNEPLMGSGKLPDWFRNKKSIISLDTYDDNLCFWRCLALFDKTKRALKSTNEALNLAKIYYKNP